MHRGQRDLLNGKLKMENGKLNTLKIFNFQLSIFNSRVAFTLAEVLITLGVIGVVAAVTMPVLMTNINERVNSERQANIVYKITQAMEHMRATGKLTAYDSTESFVDELEKHLKIAKRCDKNHIADCWTTEKVTKGDGEEFNIADAKTGENLSLTTKTNNVGLILADGASIILNYDNNSKGLDIGDKVIATSYTLPTGNNKSKVFEYTTNVTAPVAFIMDVNGKKGPNRETADNAYYDIRNFGGARLHKFICPGELYNDMCIYKVGTSYSAMDCSDANSSSEDYKNFCGTRPSGYTADQWAGARAKCAGMNMSMPTISQLDYIKANKTKISSLLNDNKRYYSSTETSQYMVACRYLGNSDNGCYKGNGSDLLCIQQ